MAEDDTIEAKGSLGAKSKTWNPGSGLVTRAYDDWHMAEKGLRSFLRLGREFSEEGYQSRWDRIAKSPGDENGPEVEDLFYDETGGLTSIEFDWLLMNLVVRDGVTLYEVYLETVLHEVVAHRVHGTIVGETSPQWRKLTAVFKQAFGMDIESSQVKEAIALRHLLTHRRGELRTDAMRKQHDKKKHDFPDIAVRLEPDEIFGHLDALADAVEKVDRVMFPFAWGDAPVPHEMHDELLLSAPWLF
jgi:hypothetical protein